MDARDLFDILAREHVRMLHVYVRCLVSAGEVDDIVQDALVTAWKNLDKFDRTRPFGPWLRGIAKNLVLAHHRKTIASVPYDPAWLTTLEDRCAALHRQPGDTFDEKLDALRNCIAKLPEPYRQAIRLRYHENVTGEALAHRLQITFENLKKRLQRGREWLLECLTGKLKIEESLT